jgi:hypothetical protein
MADHLTVTGEPVAERPLTCFNVCLAHDGPALIDVICDPDLI